MGGSAARRLGFVAVILLALLPGRSAEANQIPCGQYWPSQYNLEVYESEHNYFQFTLRFRLSESQLVALRCVDNYLEIDFDQEGFGLPAHYNEYLVGTDLPGGIHDVEFPDTEITPGVTAINTNDLLANVDYLVTVGWLWPEADLSGLGIAVDFVPSHWAGENENLSLSEEAKEEFSCDVIGTATGNDAWCIFGTHRHRFVWRDFGGYLPISGGTQSYDWPVGQTVFASTFVQPDTPPLSADSDSDGVPDEADHCLTTPGPIHNNGCPTQNEILIFSDGTVSRIGADGVAWPLVSGLARSHGMVECSIDGDPEDEVFSIENRAGNWYVALGDSVDNGNRLEWDGSFSQTFSQPIWSISCGDQNGDGTPVVKVFSGGTIYRINPSTGQAWSLISGLGRAHEMVECDQDLDGVDEIFTVERRNDRWYVAKGDPRASQNYNLNRPGFDGGSFYVIPTPVGEACWAA